MENRGSSTSFFKRWKKKCQCKILYLNRFFKNTRKINIFSDEGKLRNLSPADVP